jgi:peptidoglycan hydrolase-like protein with peptidoglycan-binding domain
VIVQKAMLLLLGVSFAGSLWADDLTRALQQRLKDQGFYYGEVDGQPGDETSAAIRRYQIRYGLKVTGQLNDETRRSLNLSGNGNREGPLPERQPQPLQGQRPSAGDQEPDYENYRQPPRDNELGPFAPPEGSEDYRQVRPRTFARPEVVTSLPELFGGTIYERAPEQVQENVLYAVQGELVRRGLFRGALDGRPGPATTEAVARLQVEEDLPVSGRLDNETLDDLQAFPGQRNGPPVRGMRPWRGRGPFIPDGR